MVLSLRELLPANPLSPTALPVFNGDDDAYGWVLDIDKFLAEIEISSSSKLLIASFGLQGPPLQWWLQWSNHHPMANWESFVPSFLWRFKPEWRPILPVLDDENEPVSESLTSVVAPSLTEEEAIEQDGPVLFSATSSPPCAEMMDSVTVIVEQPSEDNSFDVANNLAFPSWEPPDDDLSPAVPPRPPDPSFFTMPSLPPPPSASSFSQEVIPPPSDLFNCSTVTKLVVVLKGTLSKREEWLRQSSIPGVFTLRNGLFTTTTPSSSHLLTAVPLSNLQMLPPPLPEPPDSIYFTVPVSLLPLEPTHHLFDEMPERDAAKFFAAEVSRIISIPYDPGPLVTEGIDTSAEVCLMFRYRVQCRKFHTVAMIYILEYPCGNWIMLVAIEILRFLDNFETPKVLVDDASFTHNESKQNLLRAELFIFVDDFEIPIKEDWQQLIDREWLTEKLILWSYGRIIIKEIVCLTDFGLEVKGIENYSTGGYHVVPIGDTFSRDCIVWKMWSKLLRYLGGLYCVYLDSFDDFDYDLHVFNQRPKSFRDVWKTLFLGSTDSEQVRSSPMNHYVNFLPMHFCDPQDFEHYVFFHVNHFKITGTDLVVKQISIEVLINSINFITTFSNCYVCYKFLEEDGLLFFDLEMQIVWDTLITCKCSIEMAQGFLRNMLTNLLNCLVIVLTTCVLLMAYNKNFPRGFQRVLLCLIKFYTQLKISTQPSLKEALFSQIATLSYAAGCLLQRIAHPWITTSACSLIPLLHEGMLYGQELSNNKYFAAITHGNCTCALSYPMCVIVQLPLAFAMPSGDINLEVHNLVVKATLNNVHFLDSIAHFFQYSDTQDSTIRRCAHPAERNINGFTMQLNQVVDYTSQHEPKHQQLDHHDNYKHKLRQFDFVVVDLNLKESNSSYFSYITGSLHFRQWDPGEHFWMSKVLRSFQSKQWDPGKFIHREKFTTLRTRLILMG